MKPQYLFPLASLILAGCSFYPTNRSVGTPFCAAGEGEVYELAVYRVASAEPAAIAAVQHDLRTRLGRYPGFRCALPLSGHGDNASRADLIVWRSVNDAQKAAVDIAQSAERSPLDKLSPTIEIRGFFDGAAR
jgi:hypothetical protein